MAENISPELDISKNDNYSKDLAILQSYIHNICVCMYLHVYIHTCNVYIHEEF